MTSLSSALSIALSGLRTSTSLLELASNNISNAHTAGYTDKQASVSSVDYGPNFGGATIASYTRSADQALTNNYNNATTSAGYYGTLNSYLSQVQSTLDSTNNPPQLAQDIAQFSSAWSQYSSSTDSVTAMQSVISTGQVLASDINTVSSSVTKMQGQVTTDITTDITSLNSNLQQVATLNDNIRAATTTGQPYVDMEDQRDQLINKIAGLTNVTVQPRDGNQIALYTSSGQLLVDAGQAQTFTYNGTTILDPTGADVSSGLTGGSLQARLQFADTSAAATANTTAGVGVLSKLSNQISALVTALTSTTGVFGSAYAQAVTTSTTGSTATQSSANVASTFFSSTGGTLSVNSTLTSGTQVLPQSGVIAVANSFNTTANYSNSNIALTAPSVSYAGLVTSILSGFQQSANIVSSHNTTASDQQSFYKTSLTSETAVNMDTELANLVTYQNSYAAAAHVITTVNQMLQTLMTTVGG